MSTAYLRFHVRVGYRMSTPKRERRPYEFNFFVEKAQQRYGERIKGEVNLNTAAQKLKKGVEMCKKKLGEIKAPESLSEAVQKLYKTHLHAVHDSQIHAHYNDIVDGKPRWQILQNERKHMWGIVFGIEIKKEKQKARKICHNFLRKCLHWRLLLVLATEKGHSELPSAEMYQAKLGKSMSTTRTPKTSNTALKSNYAQTRYRV